MSELALAAGTTRIDTGALPTDWKAMQLRDFCSFVQGGRLGLTKQDHYRSSGVPAFSAAGQDGYVDVVEFRDTDAVILSAIGANCGRCFLAAGNWTTLANVQVIIPRPSDAIAPFLHYRVNRDDYWPRSGSAQPFIKPSDIRSCWVALPPVPQQAAIAKVLDTLDTAIHETEAIIAKLKAVKQGLLHDLLTRGIDANGELRPPQSEAPHLYKQSPLGWIPKEWEVGSIATMADILDSQRVPVNEVERSKRSGDVPYYGANGQQGWIDRPLFDEPLILLAEDGGNFDDYAARPIAYRIDGPSWVNNHAHILKARAHCSQDFVFFSLVHRDIRRYISGGTRTKLTAKDLKSIELPCPPRSEQATIAERLEAIEERLRYELQLRGKLTREKVGLMDDLLTGRVRVTPLLQEAQHA